MGKRRKKKWIVDNVICEYPLTIFFQLYENTNHRRLEVFIKKGTTCVYCGRKADRVKITCDKDFGEGSLHVDLYCGDVLMNVDHVHPKAKGGSDKLENKVPSCEPCNRKKSDKILKV